MRRALHRPRGRLAKFVESIEVLEPSTPGEIWRIEYLPTAASTIVIRGTDVSFRGPHLRFATKVRPAMHKGLRVFLRPGAAYPFIGRDLHTNEHVWLAADDLLTHDVVKVMAALEARLVRSTFEPPSILAVRRAMRLLSTMSVEAVAREVGLSSRQLRRAFEAATGLTPKVYARIARFQRAIDGDVSGYFDQSHMIAEFRDLTGQTPRAFTASRDRHPRPA